MSVIIQYHQLELIMHPVIQRLIHVKWDLFGKWGSAKLLSINLYYTMIWTILGIFLVPDKGDGYYTPLSKSWWRILLELNGVGLTLYFMFMELSQIRNNESVHNRWTHWKTRHMEKDLQFCHPRWPEEKKYISAELEQIRSYHRTYFRDPWNIFEWVAYVVVLSLVITRMLTVVSGGKSNIQQNFDRIHCRLYALGLIILWLRFMRSCRVFRTLGPFIAILGDIISDTMKFAFLFFEFFIPYTVAFWILFGENRTGDEVEKAHPDWVQFNDLVYSIWTMTLGGTYDWDSIVKADRLMAQILSGSYIALASVVCMNLYIALLSDTFARIYAEAQANAIMQQATTIIMLEGKLNKLNTSKCAHYMQTECSPQMVYYQDDPTAGESAREDPSDRVCRQIVSRIDEFEESMKENISSQLDKMEGGGGKRKESMDSKANIALFMREQTLFQKEMRKQMDQMMKMITELQSGGGLMMNQMNYHAGGSDADSEPGSPLIRILSSDDDQSSVGSGSSGAGSQVPLIAQALSKMSSSRDNHDNPKGSLGSMSLKGSTEIPKIYPELPKRPDLPPKREIQWARAPQSQQNGSENAALETEMKNGNEEQDDKDEDLVNDSNPTQFSRIDHPPPPSSDMGLGSTVRFYPAIPMAYSAESELKLLPSMPDLNDLPRNNFEEIPMMSINESLMEEERDV